MPNRIGSFSSGDTTSIVVKMELKKLEIFFSSIHASRKLLYSLCFSTYMKMVNSTWFYGPGATTFAHKVGGLALKISKFQNDLFLSLALRAKIATFQYKLLNKTQW